MAAGFPSPTDDYLEDGIDLNKLLVCNAPVTFFDTVESDAFRYSTYVWFERDLLQLTGSGCRPDMTQRKHLQSGVLYGFLQGEQLTGRSVGK